MNANPKDPLLQAGTDRAQQLFRTFSQISDGFPADAAIQAALNILVNAIRQAAPHWRQAEPMWDQYTGKTKQVLKNHYDSIGRLRGVFPFDQTLIVSDLLEIDKLSFDKK